MGQNRCPHCKSQKFYGESCGGCMYEREMSMCVATSKEPYRDIEATQERYGGRVATTF